MAKGNKNPSPETRFKPGNPGGPGQPKIDPEVKRIRKFTAQELEELITTLLALTDEERIAVLKDPKASTIKKCIASVLTKAGEQGNMSQLDMVLNRVIGKVKEKIEHEGLQPSILVRRNGDIVEFSLTKKQDEEE